MKKIGIINFTIGEKKRNTYYNNVESDEDDPFGFSKKRKTLK